MTYQQSIAQYGLIPDDESLPAIRELLAQEAELERAGEDREDDLALLCCLQLFSRGLLEDVLRIWDAKQSGFDLSIYLGVQFLCGAGLEETKKFLAEHPAPEAAEALKYLSSCERSGDFKDWTPSRQFEGYRRYFQGVPDTSYEPDSARTDNQQ